MSACQIESYLFSKKDVDENLAGAIATKTDEFGPVQREVTHNIMQRYMPDRQAAALRDMPIPWTTTPPEKTKAQL